MEIKYLLNFLVLAETGNFSEAADILYISQSTLSKHIKSLELELGETLFDRTTRKVSVNKFGKHLLPYAQKIVTLQDQYLSAMQNSMAADLGSLNLGSLRDLVQYNITDILVAFRNSLPHANINIVYAGSEHFKELLRQKKCDLAFIRGTDEVDKDLVKIPYAVDSLVAVLPVEHTLAKKKSISLQMLAGLDFLLVEEGMYVYKLCVNACRQSGFEPKVVYKDNRFENLVELVVKGMGVALLMKPLVIHLREPGIAILDIIPTISTHINLCYLKGTKLPDIARHFVACALAQREKNRAMAA